MSYWIDKHIVDLDDMLEHVRHHVKSYFYDVFHETPDLIPTQDYTFEIGYHCPAQVHVKDGYRIQKPGFHLYFEKEKLLTWKGNYVPQDMGITFTLN